ncbi:MCE family protein, partial [Mycobacterium palustre]|uniref:MCE family protein n=1 Tax=Mycobacterium palustre TaxID=153971 RepID=UPI0021F28B27
LARGAQDLVPSAQLLDTYSPAIFCTLRNYHDIEPKAAAFLGGNGYSLNSHTQVLSGLGLLLNPVSAVTLIGLIGIFALPTQGLAA